MFKRTLILILALVLIMTTGICGAFATGDDLEILPGFDFKQGDVNIDGSISIKDVTLIQKILAKIKSVSEHQLGLADVDGKKGLSIKDATYLQKWIADLVDVLYSPDEVETTSAEILPTFGVSLTTASEELTESTTQIASEIETSASDVFTENTETTETTVTTVATEPQETTTETIVTDPTESTSVQPTSSVPAETDVVTEATETTTKITIITLPFVPAN